MDLRSAAHHYLSLRKRLGEDSIWLSAEGRKYLNAVPVVAPAAKAAERRDRPPVSEREIAVPVVLSPRPVSAKAEPILPPSVSAPLRKESTLTRAQKEEELAQLREKALGCVRCDHLAKSRTQVVFGVGNPDATVMFVGEAPGADEDLEGEPFVGMAGKLLTKMIEAMGLSREGVYIGNVLKCRPDMPAGSTGNRKPTGKEMATCLPYLTAQIEIIQPSVLVCLGATAVEGLLGLEKITMGKLRGHWQDFRGIPTMVTYHPAYLLRNQSMAEKRKVWEDLLLVMEKAGLSISEKQRNFFKGR